MLPYLDEFLLLATAHLIAVASPGPDFAVVLKHSISYGRRTAVMTSLGVGAGIILHVCYSLLGIGLLISQSPIAFQLMKYAAAAYLFYLGYSALRARPATDEERANLTSPKELPFRQAFRTGFLTNALNPKATLFFLSLFTVIISPNTPIAVQAGYGVYLSVATAIWFVGLSICLSHFRVRHFFHQLGHWFERIMGTVLIGLGLRLVLPD